MNKRYMSDNGIGVKTDTYFILLLFYGYGDLKAGKYMHKAVFGVN